MPTITIVINILRHHHFFIREGVFAPPWCNTSEAGLGGCAILLAAHFSMIKLNMIIIVARIKKISVMLMHIDCIAQVKQG